MTEEQQQPAPPSTSLTPEPMVDSPSSNKGLIIGIIVAVAVIIIGASAFVGFKSSSNYQGFLNKVEQQTAELKGNDNDSIISEPIIEEPAAASTAE